MGTGVGGDQGAPGSGVGSEPATGVGATRSLTPETDAPDATNTTGARNNTGANTGTGTARTTTTTPATGIAGIVQRSIQADTSLQQWSTGINVSGDSRNIVLEGIVPDERTRNLIEQRARSSAGSAQIENRIRVNERAGTMNNTRGPGTMNNTRGTSTAPDDTTGGGTGQTF